MFTIMLAYIEMVDTTIYHLSWVKMMFFIYTIHRKSTIYVIYSLVRCEILFDTLDIEQMEELGLNAEITTRQRFVQYIEIKHTLFFKIELYRSMYFILYMLLWPILEVSKRILASSPCVSCKSNLTTFIYLCPYETFDNVMSLIF